MVEYITGSNGSGKTKVLIEAAEETAKNSKGNVIYLDSSDKLFLTLDADIRLINAENYFINGAISFCGFLVGLCAGDYDLTDVFVDSTLDIISKASNGKTNIDDLMEIVTEVSNATGVNFHFAVGDSMERELAYQSVSE